MPPFWTALIMIVALSLSQAVLALPIAAAGVGPLPSVALIVLLGLANVVSMAQMAETFSRHGTIRYSGVFLGRVVRDFVGDWGAIILTGATALRMGIGLLACFIGLASTLGDISHVPPTIWAAGLFVLAPYLLAGKRLNFSTSLSVVFGMLSVSLIVALSLLALVHVRLSNLTFTDVPLLNGNASVPLAAQALIGVVVQVYLGQSYLIQTAKAVLPRDPSGKSLIQASSAATVLMMILLSLWVIAVNGALSHPALIGQTGTVLVPLAEAYGPLFGMLASPLVVLLLGLAYIRQSTVLVGLADECLPARLTSRARFWFSMTPVAVVFIITEWLYAVNADSFTGAVAIGGLLGNSLVVGIFPPLLIIASRRRGENVPGLVIPWLANWVVAGGLYVLFLGILLLHAIVIWQEPLHRAAALAVALIAIAGTALMVKAAPVHEASERGAAVT
jgi:hypothetical protein